MLILTPISLGFCFMAIWQVGFGHQVGNHPAPDSVTVILALFLCTLTAAFYFARLETVITGDGISYRFRFGLSYGGHIAWPDVAELRFMRYPYIGEGIRLHTEINAWAYVTEGDERIGILIIRKNGKRNILLSTQQVSALKDYIKGFAPQGVRVTED